jgi:hypothetical protein
MFDSGFAILVIMVGLWHLEPEKMDLQLGFKYLQLLEAAIDICSKGK